jgi:hypothetical protein
MIHKLVNFLILNQAGTRMGRATWLYFALWAIVIYIASKQILTCFALLSPLILLLNRLDTSGPTKEEVEQVSREVAAEKEIKYLLGKWVGRHKGLVKIVDIFSIRFGRFSLIGWLSILVVVTVLGTIFYQRSQYTNRMYLKELIESHTIEKAASKLITASRKTESTKGSDNEWKVIEQRLSDCMVKEANLYLESGDPYLFEKANKITPRVLATRFFKSCGAIENNASSTVSQ